MVCGGVGLVRDTNGQPCGLSLFKLWAAFDFFTRFSNGDGQASGWAGGSAFVHQVSFP